jgi:hypothetical protein
MHAAHLAVLDQCALQHSVSLNPRKEALTSLYKDKDLLCRFVSPHIGSSSRRPLVISYTACEAWNRNHLKSADLQLWSSGSTTPAAERLRENSL